MIKYLSILNHRTLITFLLSLLVPFCAFHFEIIYNIDLTLISIAIIFPLVFAIRGAFKRREKALEFLSLHRGALKTISYYFLSSRKLSDDAKIEIVSILEDLSESFLNHLSLSNYDTSKIDQKTALIVDFLEKHDEEISGGVKQKIYRFIRDVHVSQENLIAIHTHRTPISLKAYCLIFIYMFPVIYTPTIINKIGFDNPTTLTYFVVMISEFILISLYNIQDQMEYPFDKDGLDDIKLQYFKFNRGGKK
ncbi:MAG: hypothetical protein P8I30_02400 [Flavobacteriaceae bacterium]|nr:hypothetical protein [Flavobacteriaceae bacterium]